ncbi:MAG: amidohydrolase family protein [Bryobacterales bacterium]|nr:amidohydrolase family protein [Bryobacterales bacterium]
MIGAAIAILNVTLIDGTGAPPKTNQTVIVRDGRIVSVGDAKAPKDAQVIDGSGKFLIPGLWDMHAHVLPDAGVMLRWGVTGVRNMHIESADAIRIALDAKQRTAGPRIVTNGVIVDGPQPVYPASARAGDAGTARAIARQAKDYGLDFLKVYDFVPRDAYFTLARESKRLKLPLTGHVPVWITLEEAARAGQRSVEHLSGVFEACTADANLQDELKRASALWMISRKESAKRLQATVLKMTTTYDGSVCKPLFELLAWKKVWQCPTLVVLREARAAAIQVVREMHAAGVPLLAGTDAGSNGVVPGESLHQELELLVSAGLTPMEALQAATSKPAQFLGLSKQLGTVQKGRLADLVLLDANPLEDIRNTRRIAAVISRGRVVPSDP